MTMPFSLPFGYYLVRQGTVPLPPACPPAYIAVSSCRDKTVIPAVPCRHLPFALYRC
jgi:hypothetical protein